MAIEETKLWWYWCYHFDFTVLLILMTFLVVTSATTKQQAAAAAAAVPCFFIFGDSYVDSGNNNNLVTAAKGNYLPYGIDFQDSPTGRFTNGRTFVDFIGQYMGFDEFIPPFATAEGEEIINGVNYASGSSGIRDETGYTVGDRFSMNRQLLNHNTTRTRLANLLVGNESSANEHLRKCLYAVYAGGNDYVRNYFAPQFYNTSKLYTLDQFTGVLIRLFSQQMKALYTYGARKTVLFGIGPLGCLPIFLISDGKNETVCDERINAAVQKFNQMLKALVDRLNRKLRGAKFIYINTFGILTTNPSAIGLGYSSEPCCKISSRGTCIPDQIPCKNRALHMHWDGLHLTEIAHVYISIRSYTALLPSDAYPTSIRHLVQNS